MGQVIDQIKNWTWNDPVSNVYNSLFTEEAIEDPKLNEEEVKKDLEYRYLHKNTSKNFKDEGKEDDGIGDLLIWFTILEVANEIKKDVILFLGRKNGLVFTEAKDNLYIPDLN
ncbi:MAG: hypothetical protein IPF81_19195 [Bacteroidetes bacterium]|nr:hypothetical protein [Bacteroidota bacterium]